MKKVLVPENLQDCAGIALRTLRKQRGWTQEHLASIFGVQQSAVCKMETGVVGIQLHTLLKLSEADAAFVLHRGRTQPSRDARSAGPGVTHPADRLLHLIRTMRREQDMGRRRRVAKSAEEELMALRAELRKAPAEKPSCASCCYSGEGLGSPSGPTLECHKAPPGNYPNANHLQGTQWPQVAPQDWCGAFR